MSTITMVNKQKRHPTGVLFCLFYVREELKLRPRKQQKRFDGLCLADEISCQDHLGVQIRRASVHKSKLENLRKPRLYGINKRTLH